MSHLLTILKNIFIALLIIYISPFLVHGIKTNYAHIFEPTTRVGILKITNAETSLFESQKVLQQLLKDSSIKAIIVLIDCSTNSSGSTQSLAHELELLKKEYPKPIIAFIEGYCLNGAYTIAASCSTIIASPGALINPLSKAAVNEFCDGTVVNELRNEIIEQVIRLRKHITSAQINTWNNILFTSKQALAVGLIDQIGSLSTLYKTLKKFGIKGNSIMWINPLDHDFLQSLLSNYITV